MHVVLIQSWHAAVMGELDLQLELGFRDGEFAHRAGSPDPIPAPDPIRWARGQLPIFDSFSCLFASTIERLHEEFRRRVKTQGSLPNEDAALILLFSLVASGQIRLRRIDGWRKIATVLRQHTPRAA